MSFARNLRTAFYRTTGPTASAVRNFTLAARNGNLRVMSEYLDTYGSALIDRINPQEDSTALMLAARFNKMDCLQALLRAGAKTNIEDKQGNTALHHAVIYADGVEALLKSGAEVDTPNHKGQTALILAAFHGRNNSITHLLNHHANINAQDKSGLTPLMHAIFRQYSETVNLLCESKANLELRDLDNNTALFHAVAIGLGSVLDNLLAAKPNLEVRNEHGNTPLMYAAGYSSTYILWKLVMHGADIGATNQNSQTAFHIAKLTGNTECLNALTAWCIQIGQKDIRDFYEGTQTAIPVKNERLKLQKPRGVS